MTVSEFSGLETRIPVEEARRKMQAAESALYPHLTKEGAENMWRSWADVLWQAEVEQRTPPAGSGATFYWNGRPVAPAELRQKLGGALGSGLAA